MPLEPDDQRRIDDAKREFGADGSGTKVLVLNASEAQKLGPFTVACIIMNRTIGTYIDNVLDAFRLCLQALVFLFHRP